MFSACVEKVEGVNVTSACVQPAVLQVKEVRSWHEGNTLTEDDGYEQR